MSARSQIISGLAAEVAFSVLPLLVILMVFINLRQPVHFFSSPEWSFGSAILFGQAFVRFIAGLVRHGRVAQGPVALIIAVLLVFGLTPSLVVLIIVLQSSELHCPPSLWLQILQVTLFGCAAAAHVLLGTVGELWIRPEGH
jgi:hypothetical protein